MKRRTLPFIVFVFGFTCLSSAQEFKMISADEAQIIDEIKGFALFENNKVIIGAIPPADQREKQYRNVDLQKDDEVVFVNGKKIKSISDFKKYYNEIKTGAEVKFGIRRNSQSMIITFTKAEPSKGNKKIMTITTDGKSSDVKAKVESGKVIIGTKKLDIDSLKKSGAKVQIQKSK